MPPRIIGSKGKKKSSDKTSKEGDSSVGSSVDPNLSLRDIALGTVVGGAGLELADQAGDFKDQIDRSIDKIKTSMDKGSVPDPIIVDNGVSSDILVDERPEYRDDIFIPAFAGINVFSKGDYHKATAISTINYAAAKKILVSQGVPEDTVDPSTRMGKKNIRLSLILVSNKFFWVPSTKSFDEKEYKLISSEEFSDKKPCAMELPFGVILIYGEKGQGKSIIGHFIEYAYKNSEYMRFGEPEPPTITDPLEAIEEIHDFINDKNEYKDVDVLIVDSFRYFLNLASALGTTGTGGVNNFMYNDLTNLNAQAIQAQKTLIIVINPMASLSDAVAAAFESSVTGFIRATSFGSFRYTARSRYSNRMDRTYNFDPLKFLPTVDLDALERLGYNTQYFNNTTYESHTNEAQKQMSEEDQFDDELEIYGFTQWDGVEKLYKS